MPKKTKKNDFYCPKISFSRGSAGSGMHDKIMVICLPSVLEYGEEEQHFVFGQYAAYEMSFPDDAVALEIDDLDEGEVATGNAHIGKVMKEVQGLPVIYRSYIVRVFFPYLLASSVHRCLYWYKPPTGQ